MGLEGTATTQETTTKATFRKGIRTDWGSTTTWEAVIMKANGSMVVKKAQDSYQPTGKPTTESGLIT